ncbi:MAG: hypothetical protein ACUVX1_15315 [Chloroflexota bacterium]
MHNCDWYFLDASTSRMFRPGHLVYGGEHLGSSARDGQDIRATSAGKVIEIQYDVESDELIVVVESGFDGRPGGLTVTH